MVSVTIYAEGGGESKELRTRCREGFRKLLANSGFVGRMPGIVACGSRNNAFERFRTAAQNPSHGTVPILLVDSEDPVTHFDAEGKPLPWAHLKSRDGWDPPAGVEDRQAHLMSTCMETWVMADSETIGKVFGSCLQKSALLPLHEIESKPRDEVQGALAHATRNCGRSKYSKGKRSFQLLEQLEANRLKDRLKYFKRLIDVLEGIRKTPG